MAAPTQALPSWLSYSTSLATNDAGEPTATFTSVVNLPLTYFGPSVPLGSDSVWVFGGSSSPALSSPDLPTTLPTSSGSVLSLSTIATPTSASALPSTSLSSSPSSSPSPSSPPPSLSSTLTTSPATTTTTRSPLPSSSSSSPITSSAINGASSSHSHRAGVIVGSVLGAVVGSLMLLFALIWFMHKRRGDPRRRDRPPSEPPTSQVMWMWHDVRRGEDDQDADLDAQLRSPGDASPQSSGDERDAFLRRSGDASHITRASEPTARLVDVPRSSRESSGPVGVALASGSKAGAPSRGPRHIIPPKQLADAVSPEEAEPGPDAPLLPPPAVNLNTSHGSRRSLLPSERSMTPGNDPESALLYTAQRVQVGRSAQSSPGSGWAEGIGVPSVLRRSWLNPKRRSGTPTTPSQKSSFLGRQLTDSELEAGRSLNVQLRSDLGYRDAVRPLSGVSMMSSGSARSGNTVFYDAQSRDDLASAPSSPVPPLPQGMASTTRSGGTAGPSPLSAAPVRAASQSEGSTVHPASQPEERRPHDDAADYLDAPIPRPASPFASVSSTNRMPSPSGFRGPGSDPAAVPSADISDAINAELLEEEPPAAGENWRQIAQGLSTSHERRTTFGMAPSMIVYPREQAVSEEGSLHSMRSRLSPHSALSASGSAPASNSNSLHSRGVTGSSSKSLTHSSSVSSIDRRPSRRSPGEVSPPLSATGWHGHRRSPSSNPHSQSHPHSGIGEPLMHPQPLIPRATTTSITTTGTTGSSVTTHTSTTDPITGEVGRLSHPPWTGGRDFDYLPEESEPSGDDAQLQPSLWGGGWSSPNHLRILQNRVAGRENPGSRG